MKVCEKTYCARDLAFASSARQTGPFPGPGFPAVLGILMYFNIHSGSCAPAEHDLPSLATVFSQTLSAQDVI
ncbi:MAG: hypothetical protein ACREU9_12640, partial [Gammaproteobacteria bacterium]